MGGHVFQNRLLVEVVANHVGHVAVHGFVVGHAVAHGIHNGHVALAVGPVQARHAERAIGPEYQRVDVLVVDAAVNHVDPLQAARGFHVHEVVVHDEVAAFDQPDAHEPGQGAVLKISRVVDARRKQHHGGLAGLPAAQRQQVAKQQIGVVFHRQHVAFGQQIGKNAVGDAPVFEHVRHPGGRAQVVFQHIQLAVVVPNQIHARDVRVDIVRHVHVHHLAQKLRAGVHQRRRHDAVFQDELLVVNVFQEDIQRPQPLLDAGLNALPLGVVDDARDDVERENLSRFPRRCCTP